MVDFPINTSLVIGLVSDYDNNTTVQHISRHGDPNKFETGDLEAEFGPRLLLPEDILQLFTDSSGKPITEGVLNRISFFQEFITQDQLEMQTKELIHAYRMTPSRDPREIILDVLNYYYGRIDTLHLKHKIPGHFLGERLFYETILNTEINNTQDLTLILALNFWICISPDYPIPFFASAMGSQMEAYSNATFQGDDTRLLSTFLNTCYKRATPAKRAVMDEMNILRFMDMLEEIKGELFLEKTSPRSGKGGPLNMANRL